MSIIGPRPGLWNQDVLTAERDKYGANDVKPGLTGWAQINGRDELEIPEKAKLDGYYVQNMGFKMDRSSDCSGMYPYINRETGSIGSRRFYLGRYYNKRTFKCYRYGNCDEKERCAWETLSGLC